jgi:type I restriction enzyme S subunit
MVVTARDVEIKPGYKLTEVGVISEDWEVKKLGNLGRVIRGASPRPQGDRRYYGGNIPRLMVEDVTRDGKYVTPRVDFLTEEGAKRSRPCKKSTLTIVCSGTVGIPSFLAVDACIHDGFLALVDINKRVSKDYLYHQLMILKGRFEISATHGGVFTNLTTNILNDFQIPLPPFAEQEAIAPTLTDVDALITSLDKLIAKKRDIKQTTMQQLLTGKMRLPGFSGHGSAKLGDFFELNPGKTHLNNTDLVTFIGMEDISESGCIIKQNVMPLSSIKKGLTFFERNDVLIAKITPCFENGKGACLDTLETKSGFGSTEFHVLRAKKNAIPRYIFYQTQTVEFRQRLEAEMVGTAGQKRVPTQAIINYSVPVLHSKDEQHAIATVLSDMDAEIVALEQKCDKTRALKQGMMQELLTGKTRLL